MSLIKLKNRSLSPTSWFDDFFNDDFFLVPSSKGNSIPATNIEETDEEFILNMAIPGMNKEDINVELDNGVLTVSGEREDRAEESEKNYTRKEYSFSSFKRSFTIPENATETVTANYKDGVLNITIPKKEIVVSQTKKVKVA